MGLNVQIDQVAVMDFVLEAMCFHLVLVAVSLQEDKKSGKLSPSLGVSNDEF